MYPSIQSVHKEDSNAHVKIEYDYRLWAVWCIVYAQPVSFLA